MCLLLPLTGKAKAVDLRQFLGQKRSNRIHTHCEFSMDAAAKLFRAVKPKCVTLAQLTLSENSTTGSIELLNALKDLDSTLKSEIETSTNDGQLSIPVNLSDYIMVPITRLFQSDSMTDSELEVVLSIIHVLLKYSWCQPGALSNELFIQYVTLITFLIGGKPGQFSMKTHSDDTVMNGVLCLQVLLQGCLNQDSTFTSRVLENSKFVPTLGFLVSTLLNIAVESQISAMKAHSLKTLNILFHLIDNGEILSLFFPGSVSSIAKIVTSRPHSNVLSEAFVTLTTLVSSIFSDFDLEVDAESKFNSLDSLRDSIEDSPKENLDFPINTDLQPNSSLVITIPESATSLKQHRTTSWLRSTLNQFGKALEIILKVDLKRYDKFNIRDAIFQFDVKIIRSSFLSCYPLIPMLLRSLSAICFADPTFIPLTIESLVYIPENELLKLLLKKALEDELHKMQYNFSSPDATKAELMIQFIDLLIKILNGMNAIDASMLEKTLSRLQENIALLLEVKSTSDSKKKVHASNKQALSMERKLLLVSSHYDKSTYDGLQKTPLFNGIITKETETALENLFETISENIEQIAHFDMSNIQEGFISSNPNITIHHAVSSWILSYITKNVKTKKPFDPEDYFEIVDDNEANFATGDSLTLLHNLTYFSLETSTQTLKKCSESSTELFSITSSSIMCLRAISNTMDVLGIEFQDELIDLLYPIVECLASSSELIRTEAQIVVLKLANLLYDGSIEKLLSENADYLIDTLSGKLVGECLTPKIPIILSVLVKIGSLDIVAELDDIIRTIFTLLDMYHGYTSLVEGFFLVFDELLSKVYNDQKEFDFEQLATDLEDENVLAFGMWGLKSMDEVDEFINKYDVAFDDMNDNQNDDMGVAEEPLRKSKILEIDSDDDSDDENDTKSIPSQMNGEDSDDEGGDDGTKWVSPINVKLYNTITSILSYAERLAQTKSVPLVILLLKVIDRIIPLIATQKSKFLPISANLWGIVSSILNETEDFRVISRSIDVLQNLIKFGHTFFVTRFLDLFVLLGKNTRIKSLIEKQNRILIMSEQKKLDKKDTTLILNQTSTSTNWDLNTFNKICEFLLFSLSKLGRFIPIDTAISIIRITIHYDKDVDHYGYFDDLAIFLTEYEAEKTR